MDLPIHFSRHRDCMRTYAEVTHEILISCVTPFLFIKRYQVLWKSRRAVALQIAPLDW